MKLICALMTTMVLIIGVGPVSASKLDDELDRLLKGAWAVLEVEVWSSCSGTYSNNTIGDAGVASKANRRFEPGELVKIDKIKVKRARVDLLATLSVPVLVARQDGPFELFDEHECQAQLIFELGRSTIKNGDADEIMSALASTLTSHASQGTAQDSVDWNGRERQPLPPDYAQTLARYEAWKAEQTNAAVAAGIEKAVDEAAEVAEDIEQDADYLDGFAAGTEELRSLDIDDCNQLIEASFSTYDEHPPSGKSSKWKQGFEDGQSLVFHLYLARELRHCFVPVPPTPHP